MTFARLVGLPDSGENDITVHGPLARLWEGGLEDAYKLAQESPVSRMSRKAWDFGVAPPALHDDQFGLSRVHAGGYVEPFPNDDDGSYCRCHFCIVDAYWSAVGGTPPPRAGTADEFEAEEDALMLGNPHLRAALRESMEDVAAFRVYAWRPGQEWSLPVQEDWWDD